MGLIILGVFVGYIIFTMVLAKLISVVGQRNNIRWMKGWIAWLIMILIPTWDIPINKHRFKQLCEAEAGIFVYEKVGLSSEFYLEPGVPVRKMIYHSDGSVSNRQVAAMGDEINLKKLKRRYRINDHTDHNIATWSEISKFTTTIRDGDKVLGKSVSLRGGSGWFGDKFQGQSRPGVTCPPVFMEKEYITIHEKLVHDLFYKVDNKGSK